MNIAEIRKKYPQYESLSDQKLADSLYKTFYEGKIDRPEFDSQIGFVPTEPQGAVEDARPSLANPTLIDESTPGGGLSDVINEYVIDPIKRTGKIAGNIATNVTANTLDLPADILESVADASASQAASTLLNTDRGRRIIGDTSPEAIQSAAQSGANDFKSALIDPVRQQTSALRGLVPDPEGNGATIDNLAIGLGEFLTPYSGIRKGMQLGKETGGRLIRQFAPKAPGPKPLSVGDELIAGATADSIQDPEAGNLSSLIEQTRFANPITEVLATDPESNPFANRLRLVVEGGLLGMVSETVIDGFAAFLGRSADEVRQIQADDITDDVVDDIIASDDVRSILEANGILDPSEEGYQQALLRVQQRLQAREQRNAELTTPEGAERQAELEAEVDSINTVDPNNVVPPGADPTQAALRRAADAPEDTIALRTEELQNPAEPLPEVVPAAQPRPVAQEGAEFSGVDPRGQLEDPGTAAALARQNEVAGQRQLPPPQAADPNAPRAMSSTEIAQAQARGRAQVAPARAADEARPVADDTLIAPDGRAPQTRSQVQEQRQAGEAFTLAERQRGRVDETTADTQVAGRPEGVNPQQVALDEGFPVKILETRSVPNSRGRFETVAKVQRYDPRTDELVPDSTPYEISVSRLEAKDFVAEPRRAQDFQARANEPELSPENPRGPTENVTREPEQTFRATAPDPNESFPGAGSRPRDAGPDSGPNATAEGRTPFPEQPDGPHPGAARSRTEDEAIKDFEARQQQSERDSEYEEGYEQYSGKDAPKSSTKASKQDNDGRYPTDDNNFVKSDKGGPIKFNDQKQAAKWVINVGHKNSPDQVFEISNHPDGSGKYTVRERGRTEQNANAKEEASASSSKEGPSRPGGDTAARESSEAAGQARLSAPETKPKDDPLPETKSKNEPETRIVEEEDGTLSHKMFGDDEFPEGFNPLLHTDAEIRSARKEKKLRDSNSPDLATFLREKAKGEKQKDVDKAVKGVQDTFYSNPLDPKLWKALFGKMADDIVDDVETLFEDLTGGKTLTKKQLLKATAAAPLAPLKAIGNVVKSIAFSNNINLRLLANKYKDEDGVANRIITEIANMFFAPVGSAFNVGIKKVYGAARDEHIQSSMNRLADIMGRFDKMPRKQKANAITQIGKLIRSGKAKSGESLIHNAAVAVQKLLQDELKYLRDAGVEVGDFGRNFFPREIDIPRVWADPDGFVKKAAELYRAEGASAKDSRDLANAWLDALREGDDGFRSIGNDFVNNGASGTASASRFEKARTFGPNADRILADFYMNNPSDILPRYISRAARRGEWVRRMGNKNEKWEALMDKLKESGAGAARGDIVDIVSSSAGFYAPPRTNAMRNFIAGSRIVGITTYLGRATVTSLSEPFVAAIRSGNVKDGLNAYVMTLRGDLIPKILGIKNPAEKRKAALALAEDLGLVGRAADDIIMSQRVGGQIDGKVAQKIQSNYFTVTGLHHFTESSRVASTHIAQVFLRRLAKDFLDNSTRTRKSTEFMLGELGIKAEDMESFAKWVDNQGDGFPDFAKIKSGGKEGEDYGTAVSRFVEQTIMKPTGAEKPKFANHPVGGLFYHLLSYMYAFQENVINRSLVLAKRGTPFVGDKGLSLGDRINYMAPLMMMPALVGIQYGLGELRDIVLDDPGRSEESKEMTTGEKVLRATSRSGTLGIFDLGINLVSGVKFSRDPATFMLGPIFGGPSELFKAGVELGSERNSASTNTAERRATRLLYDVGVKPALVTAATLLPGLPGKVTAAVAVQALGLPVVREKAFVEPIAGRPQFKGGAPSRRAPNRSAPSRAAPKRRTPQR